MLSHYSEGREEPTHTNTYADANTPCCTTMRVRRNAPRHATTEGRDAHTNRHAHADAHSHYSEGKEGLTHNHTTLRKLRDTQRDTHYTEAGTHTQTLSHYSEGTKERTNRQRHYK